MAHTKSRARRVGRQSEGVSRPTSAVAGDTTGNEPQVDTLLRAFEALAAVAQIPAAQTAVAALAAALGQDPSDAGVLTLPEGGRKASQTWPQFLKAWRKSRNKTLDDLARVVGLSRGQLSRIENGRQGYTRVVLEGYAEALGCRPADLLSHAPFRPQLSLNSLFTQLRMPRPIARPPSVSPKSRKKAG